MEEWRGGVTLLGQPVVKSEALLEGLQGSLDLGAIVEGGAEGEEVLVVVPKLTHLRNVRGEDGETRGTNHELGELGEVGDRSWDKVDRVLVELGG